MAIVLVSWAFVGVFSVVIDIVQFRNSRAEEIKARGDAYLAEVVSTLASTAPENRGKAAQNFSPWNGMSGSAHKIRRQPLRTEHIARTWGSGYSPAETRGLKVAELSVADILIDDANDPNDLLVIFKDRVLPSGAVVEDDGTGRYLVSVFSVRLAGETDWLNCYLLMTPKDLWPAVFEGSIDSLSALIMLCLLAFLIQKIMRPLSAMAVNAELIGRGQEVGPLVEVGSIDVRRTIVAFNRMEARLFWPLNTKQRFCAV